MDVKSMAMATSKGAALTGENLAILDTHYFYRNPTIVRATDDYIFAGNVNNFTILDGSDPSNITTVGSVAFSNGSYCYDIFVVGDYAYCALTGGEVFAVIDVSDPTSPVAKDDLVLGNLSNPYGCVVSGSYAFVTSSGNDSLMSINISNPANIYEADLFTSSTQMDNVRGICVSGNTVFVAGLEDSMLIAVNISDPTNMSITSTFTDTVNFKAVNRLAIAGDYLYCVGTSCITVVDISNPASMSITDSIVDTTNWDTLAGVAVSGDLLIATFNSPSGVRSIVSVDVTDKTNIFVIDTLATAYGHISEVDIFGNAAFIATETGDLVVSIDLL